MSASERQKLTRDLLEACCGLDEDGLRFVLCVALIRGMTRPQLDALHAAVLQGRREPSLDTGHERLGQ